MEIFAEQAQPGDAVLTDGGSQVIERIENGPTADQVLFRYQGGGHSEIERKAPICINREG